MSPPSASDDHGGHPPVDCEDCRAAIRSPNRQTVSFLLFDQFTVPVVGCVDHLEQFATICGLTTEDTARLLSHLPAGGVPCPSCRNARYGSKQALIPVGEGATGVLACPEHQSYIASRFQTGLQTRAKLRSDIGGSTSI